MADSERRRNACQYANATKSSHQCVNEVIYQTRRGDWKDLAGNCARLLLHGVFVNSFKLLNNGILVGKCGDKLLIGDHLFCVSG